MSTEKSGWIPAETVSPRYVWTSVGLVAGLSALNVDIFLQSMTPSSRAWPYGTAFAAAAVVVWATLPLAVREARRNELRIGSDRIEYRWKGRVHNFSAGQFRLVPRGTGGFGVLMGGRWGYERYVLTPNQFAAARAAFPERVQPAAGRPLA